MSSLHIINTGVPGVLFCHTFIMHARLTLCAGSFFFFLYAHALSMPWTQAALFPLCHVLRLRLGAAHWRRQWLIIRFKVIICSTIEMSPTWEMHLGNSRRSFAIATDIILSLVCENELSDMTVQRQVYHTHRSKSCSIFASIIKHSVRLKQILIKCLHRCSFQSVLFSLFVGYVIQC